MKKIFKRISVIAIAISICMCGSLFAFAAEGNIAPQGSHYHDYSECRPVGREYKESQGPHTYCEGKDNNGNEIFKNDCNLYAVYQNCEYGCRMCDAVMSGSEHRHFIRFEHSKSHP